MLNRWRQAAERAWASARRLLGHGLLGPRLRVRQLLAIVLLSGLAVWGTLHSPTIFFDNQILLGGSLGVLALLQFGWLGLPVGLASALTTVALWGHPWGALILVLQLLWQQLFLWRFNGGPKQRGNGRIVLATIAFWLVVGLPLKTLLYTTLLQADLQSAVALGFKEAVVGVVNAGLGLLLYLALQLALMQRRRRVELSLRGLVFAVLLLLISLPGVLIITVMGQQITDQAFRQFRANLEQQAQAIAVALPMGSGEILLADAPLRQRFPELAFEARAAGGQQLSSDPRLFARLGQEYRSEQSGPLEDRQLSLLVPQRCRAVLQRDLQGYWRYALSLPPTTAGGWEQVVVVQPAREQVQELIALMQPSLLLLALLLIAAALISEGLTLALAHQFNRVFGPLLLPEVPGAAWTMPQLRRSGIRELNRMVGRINAQSRRFNGLARQLRRSEQQHRLLADNALDVITISDPYGRPTYISPSIEKVRGWTVAEAMALPMDQHLTPEGMTIAINALEQTNEAIRLGLPLPSLRVEMQQSHKNGGWIWTEVNSSCILDESGTYIGTLLVYRDISERKRLEAELQRRASTDELTGLLNRRELLDQLEQLLSNPERRRSGEQLALLFCDLDLFKEINDSLGHAAGDLVLRRVAERIRRSIRSDDLAARMGGDEMVVVLRSVADLEAAVGVADTLAAAIRRPIISADVQVVITASIGVTLARPAEAVDALMARADIAMYEAKQAGRDRVIRID